MCMVCIVRSYRKVKEKMRVMGNKVTPSRSEASPLPLEGQRKRLEDRIKR